jgi:hypothetical protein
MDEQDAKSRAGAYFFAAVASLLLGGAFAMSPSNLFSTSLSDMTPGMLVRAAASLALTIVGLEFLGALAIVTLSDR